MLAFVLAAFMVMGVCVSTVTFIVWSLREHHLANKYRELVRLAKQTPCAPINKVTGPAYEITHKAKGGKLLKITIPGTSEAAAIREFAKVYDVYRIEKVEKIS